MRDLWYKTAIIYELDVATFADGNGDGVGDFVGLASRLPYIAGLGATCVWLMPFYPTPNRDDGYDVTDYYSVDPRFGTLGDFVQFTHEAKSHGLRVIVDLVINHTSDQHPWFKSARRSRRSPYRDWYVWSEKRPPNSDKGTVFPGYQETIWSYDRRARAYYYHRFYDFQPDLNVANPAVREELERIMGFWLQLGVDGFRVDAAPFLIEHVDVPGQPKAARREPFIHLQDFRGFTQWRQGDAVLLGEANVPMDQIVEYFGDGDRMHMLFNFHVNQYLWLALVQERVEPLVMAIEALPDLPEVGQWASFLRNHDEIDLSGLTDQERQQVYAACGPEPTMQLYGRGVRRRLATMLGGNERRIELALSLMFSLPGTPVLLYGDELGMGEDLSLPERLSVRVPMQWSGEANGGFSSADCRKLVRPVVRGPYGYEHVNVIRQQRDPDSILNHVERLIRTYKQCPALGWARPNLIRTDQPSVLAHRSEWRSECVVVLHNLAESPCVVRLKTTVGRGERLVELISDGDYVPVERLDQPLLLEGYGYRWLRVDGARSAPGSTTG
jgi:maltose alpha-D-glucosyltransferase/alpha-amylase